MNWRPDAREMPPVAGGPLGELAARQAVEVPVRVLKTRRLVIRPLLADDRGAFLEAVRASRVELDRAHPLHEPGESDDELFDRQLALARAGDRTGKAWRRVGVRSDGVIVGAFNVNAIARGLAFEGEAAWWVRSDLGGRGLATEGVEAMAAFALADLPEGLGLYSLHAMIDPGNLASLRIADRLGFSPRPGVTAKVRVAGEWRTHEVFEVTVGTLRTGAA